MPPELYDALTSLVDALSRAQECFVTATTSPNEIHHERAGEIRAKLDLAMSTGESMCRLVTEAILLDQDLTDTEWPI